MKIKASVLKYGDNISTDDIIPGPYLHLTSADDLAKYAMYRIDSQFPQKAAKGVVLVVGKYFGCGSSREQAAICLKHAGVQAIIGKSFARIFYRNAINQGMLVVESSVCVDAIKDSDYVTIDTEKGKIMNCTQSTDYSMKPLPIFLNEIIACGGLLYWLQKKEKNKD